MLMVCSQIILRLIQEYHKSILGPLLFQTNYFSLRLFADDTSSAGKDVLLQQTNHELPVIYEWLCSNKLTLNLSKRQPRQKINYNLYPPLKLADQCVSSGLTV